MPKSKAFTSKQIIKLLEQNGFVLKRQKGGHMIFAHPKTKHRTMVPFHNKDLPKGTLHEILKQAGIDIR